MGKQQKCFFFHTTHDTVLPINIFSIRIFASYSAISVALVTQEDYHTEKLLHIDIVWSILNRTCTIFNCVLRVFYIYCFNQLYFYNVYIPIHWLILRINQ